VGLNSGNNIGEITTLLWEDYPRLCVSVGRRGLARCEEGCVFTRRKEKKKAGVTTTKKKKAYQLNKTMEERIEGPVALERGPRGVAGPDRIAGGPGLGRARQEGSVGEKLKSAKQLRTGGYADQLLVADRLPTPHWTTMEERRSDAVNESFKGPGELARPLANETHRKKRRWN